MKKDDRFSEAFLSVVDFEVLPLIVIVLFGLEAMVSDGEFIFSSGVCTISFSAAFRTRETVHPS